MNFRKKLSALALLVILWAPPALSDYFGLPPGDEDIYRDRDWALKQLGRDKGFTEEIESRLFRGRFGLMPQGEVHPPHTVFTPRPLSEFTPVEMQNYLMLTSLIDMGFLDNLTMDKIVHAPDGLRTVALEDFLDEDIMFSIDRHYLSAKDRGTLIERLMTKLGVPKVNPERIDAFDINQLYLGLD
jgi:hypothetical protein